MSSVELVLNEAGEREKEYDWLEAAESYKKALGLVSGQDFCTMGEVCERLGYACFRAAMQVETQEEFRERIKQVIEAYEKGRMFYAKLSDELNSARVLRCKAVATYLGYWLISEPSEKRRLLDECLQLESKALTVFLESGNMLEFGKTYNDLYWVFSCRVYLEWNKQTLKSIVEKGIEWGGKAVTALSELNSSHEVAKAYLTLDTCLYHFANYLIEEMDETEKLRLRAVKSLSKAIDLSEKVGDSHLSAMLHLLWGKATGGEESVKHFEKALECGERTRDNFLIAEALDWLAYATQWKAHATEDPEKRRETAEESKRLYEKSQRLYSIMSYMSPRGGVMAPPTGCAEYYLDLATWETDPMKRREFLEKSEKAGDEALRLAENSDMPGVIETACHVFSKTLEVRAREELDLTEKRELLERALKYRERSIKIIEQLWPFGSADYYWDLGIFHNYLAGIKAELSNLETDPGNEGRLLEDAALNMEKCLELCNKVVPYWEKFEVWFYEPLHRFQDTYATLLMHLYNLTNKPEHLRRAIDVSEKAIESASKVDMISLIAESYWKIAKAQDILGKHTEAAENFRRASESYTKAAEKISQLKDFYQGYAHYMEAWSEIEEARHHHKRQEYGLASEHFEKAAHLHKSLTQRSYLASNYSAWSQLENAEDLSRKEKSEEALHAFEQAAKLFKETQKILQTELARIEIPDEKQMATSLIKATNLRHEYCMARIALEEAKILDKQGSHYASSEKFGSAAEIFEKIDQALELEQDRKEIKYIISLSRAWQQMTRAEAEESPDLYTEASRLFEEAKDLSPNEKARMLSLGHSRFCMALEAGTRFEDKRDHTLHTAAIQNLESAATYYVKAGFPSASEFAKATELLFDAYMYVDNAKKESDPEKKAKLYVMAEKVLQASAGSFTKAEHPEKREQVLRLLDKVKEERELALSLSEVFHAPALVSSTTAFPTPTPTQENAVGLQRFENADIQANVITRNKELNIGENLSLQIELVNAGKSPALLIKITEVVPEGFELTEKPETFRVEDNCLNMKGKRLDSLKTEEIKLVLKPKVQGTFALKPRILYLDETGKYKSHEPEPVTIIVKELGIRGWLKG